MSKVSKLMKDEQDPIHSKRHISDRSNPMFHTSDNLFAPKNSAKVNFRKSLELPRITKGDNIKPIPLKAKINLENLGKIYFRSASDITSNTKIKIDMKDAMKTKPDMKDIIKRKDKPANLKETDNLPNIPHNNDNDNSKPNSVKDVTEDKVDIKYKTGVKNKSELKMRNPSFVKEKTNNLKKKEYSYKNIGEPETVKDFKYRILGNSSSSTNIKNVTKDNLTITEDDINTPRESMKKPGTILPITAEENKDSGSSSDEEKDLQAEVKLAFNDYLQTFESQEVFNRIGTKSATQIYHQMTTLQKRLDKNKQLFDSANSRIYNISFDSIYAHLSSIHNDPLQYDVGLETSSSAESIASVDCKTSSTKKKRSKSTKTQEDFEIYPEIIEFQNALDDTISLMEGLHQGDRS